MVVDEVLHISDAIVQVGAVHKTSTSSTCAVCNVTVSRSGFSAFAGENTLTPTSFSTDISCTPVSIYESVSVVIPSIFGRGSTSTTYTTLDLRDRDSTTIVESANAHPSTGPALFGFIPPAIQSGGARRNILSRRDSQSRQMLPPARSILSGPSG